MPRNIAKGRPRLDTLHFAKKGGDSGPRSLPSLAEPLLERVNLPADDDEIIPKDGLSEAQGVLTRWIQTGQIGRAAINFMPNRNVP